jgi:hypothetical protein
MGQHAIGVVATSPPRLWNQRRNWCIDHLLCDSNSIRRFHQQYHISHKPPAVARFYLQPAITTPRFDNGSVAVSDVSDLVVPIAIRIAYCMQTPRTSNSLRNRNVSSKSILCISGKNSAIHLSQVIQVFLVVSIASSSTAVVTQIIANPTNIAPLLAGNLPKSSNFFFSYLLLQGLSVSAGTLLQIIALILYYIFSKLLDGTPRKKWKRFNTLPGLGWGTTYPIFTNLAVIGMYVFEFADRRIDLCHHLSVDHVVCHHDFLTLLSYISPQLFVRLRVHDGYRGPFVPTGALSNHDRTIFRRDMSTGIILYYAGCTSPRSRHGRRPYFDHLLPYSTFQQF